MRMRIEMKEIWIYNVLRNRNQRKKGKENSKKDALVEIDYSSLLLSNLRVKFELNNLNKLSLIPS